MLRMDYQVKLQYESRGHGDFVLNICPARTRSQRVLNETLAVEGATPSYTFTDPVTANRINRLYTEGGPVTVRYAGTVELEHVIVDATTIEERAIRSMPSEVVPYILPSRYCPSDKMRSLALAVFGNVAPGYTRVAAICEWVTQHVRFTPDAAGTGKCAMETFDSRTGGSRDYAHLMIAMCRALNIPARYVTGVDYGADSELGPTAFQAYAEVFLGQRWYLFDASGMMPVMGLIRIGTGRDAADVSFETLFGNVHGSRPVVGIQLLAGGETQIEPVASAHQAISTAMGSLYFHAAEPAPQAVRTLVPPIPGPWADRRAPVAAHTPQHA